MTTMTAATPRPITVADYAPAARSRLSEMAWEYLAGGGGDEITQRSNRERLDALQLHPRVLVDVSRIDTTVELLGKRLGHPILLAPTGFHRLFHSEGERATARGAAAARALWVVSSLATVALEDCAKEARGPKWFQLYIQRDRGYTRELVKRAEAAGYGAICLTVDTPVLGARDREKRIGFSLPEGVEMANMHKLVDEYTADAHHSPDSIYNPYLDASVTWKDVDWLRSVLSIPLVVKGILSPEDARTATSNGVNAIVVSNHGGRNLDTLPATIDALPRVVEAVDGRAPVIMDGGIRRGTDIVKALALGARAVMIGRPYLWGLAAEGAEGVRTVVDILRMELRAAMALCGTPKLKDVRASTIWDGS